MSWLWDDRIKQFRDSATGRFLSRRAAQDMARTSIEASVLLVKEWGDQVDEGIITPATFRANMRGELKAEYIRQYVAMRGGRAQMTPADWGSVGGSLSEQFRWLDAFVAEIEAGTATGGQIRTRAAMYSRSANEAASRGFVRSQGVGVDLPAYPADGSTECLTNCDCSWDVQTIRAADGRVLYFECYWRLGATEDHCATCLERAGSWVPLRISADGGLRMRAVTRGHKLHVYRIAEGYTMLHCSTCDYQLMRRHDGHDIIINKGDETAVHLRRDDAESLVKK